MLKLQKDPKHDFCILNLSDPQLAGDEWDKDHQAFRIFDRTVKTLIEKTHPDLITVTGDLSYGGQLASYEKYLGYFRQFGIRWTTVFGNHDNQAGPEPVAKVVDMYQKDPLFIYESGDPALGNGNFVILIEEEGRPVEGLVLMDTHDRMPYTDGDGNEREEWAKLLPPQIDWYRAEIAALQKMGCKETVLFTHIPIYHYREAYAAAHRADVDPRSVQPQNSTGPDFWNPGYESSVGVLYEGISSYPEDEGMFDAIRELGSTRCVICGHDHVNNFMIRYQDVNFIYAMKTGKGCYWNSVLNGGTQITVGSHGVCGAEHHFVNVSDLL